MHLDLVLAVGLLATSLGCGWVLYRGRLARDAARATAPVGPEPIEAMQELRRQTLALGQEAAATADRIVETVRMGVR